MNYNNHNNKEPKQIALKELDDFKARNPGANYEFCAELFNRAGIFNFGNPLDYLPSKKVILVSSIFTAHHFGHIIEMPTFSRLTEQDFGIKLWIPATDNGIFRAIVREMRVRAIEDIILNTIGNRRDSLITGGLMGLYRNKPDFAFNGMKADSKELIEYSQSLYDQTLKNYDKDRVVAEFDRRILFLKDWMESDVENAQAPSGSRSA